MLHHVILINDQFALISAKRCIVVFECFADFLGAHVYITKSYRANPIKSYSQHSKSVSAQTLHDDRPTKKVFTPGSMDPRSPLCGDGSEDTCQKWKIFGKNYEN